MSWRVVLIMELTFSAFSYLQRWFRSTLTTLKQRNWKLKKRELRRDGDFLYSLPTSQLIREIKLLSLFVRIK